MTSLEPRRFDGGPDVDDLRRWVREGKTDTEIGELAGKMYGQPAAKKQTVSYWRKKHKIKREGQPGVLLDHSEVRPWRTRLEHTGDGIEHRLYDFSRRRQGIALKPADARRLDEFLDVLTRHNLVVDYDPESEFGWCFVDRDPTDDPDNIIRKP